MKKINSNKFRNNNVYSLNYKFDSISVAGKISGTALDLIKRYNELAKEAQSNGNYVEMEVFRQYAEHYRKIVTDINERRNQNREVQDTNANQEASENTAEEQNAAEPIADNGLVETEAAEPAQNVSPSENEEAQTAETPKTIRRRKFKIVDFSDKTTSESSENKAENEEKKPQRRTLKRKSENMEAIAENV